MGKTALASRLMEFKTCKGSKSSNWIDFKEGAEIIILDEYVA